MIDDALRHGLSSGARSLGLNLSPAQIDTLRAYIDLIARWNKVYNLTAVRDPHDMLTQHLLDCLALLPALHRQLGTRADTALRVLDVGSGAGLPGVVLAICQPAWQVICVDAVAKKASFIRQVGAELGLPELTASHSRVEDLQAAPFGLITSRAFASLADFVNLTETHLAPGGFWAAMKAKLSDGERAELPPRVDLFHVEPLTVPGLNAERCVVWMQAKTR